MKKKAGILILVVLLIFAGVSGGVLFRNHQKKVLQEQKRQTEQKNIKEQQENIGGHRKEWENSAILTPAAGSLQAAGSITISWNSADFLGDVSGYKIYIDGAFETEVDGETTTYEYYSTEVTSHEVYVEADMKYGAILNSDIVTFFVNKKGFCTNKDMAMELNAKKWGVSWYYNWAMEPFKYTSFQDLEYVPMLWTIGSFDERNMQLFNAYQYKYLLTYNEPDRSDQSDLSVEQVMEGMKTVFENRGNLKIGSPATAQLPKWSKDWFQPYMKEMEQAGYDLDFIAIHHYWNWYADEGVDAFIELIEDAYERYHKPIWITEFAISGVPSVDKKAEKVVQNYMKKVIQRLDQLDYVERYAWFSFQTTDRRNSASSMFNHYTGEITDLGALYQKAGMPEGYGEKIYKTPKENPIEDVLS